MQQFSAKSTGLRPYDGSHVTQEPKPQRWLVNGKLHRTDGPAIELTDGSKHWFVDGKRHRIDGPAVEHADGAKQYYLFGEEYDDIEVFRVASDMLAKLFPEMIDKR